MRDTPIIQPRELHPHAAASMTTTAASRRRFIAGFAGLGLGSAFLPSVLWSKVEDEGVDFLTAPMLKEAARLAGHTFTEAECTGILQNVKTNLKRYIKLHAIKIPDHVAPPFYFNPLVPGMMVNRTRTPFKASAAPKVKRPANLEDVAFWPVMHLAALIKSRVVTSLELTDMYLSRLKRINAKLNCVVTFTEDLAHAQAKQADREIAAGNYKGPLHGIPWGCKDIIAVKGYKTTWGSDAFKEQVIEEDATVVEQLTAAGAVLIAKLTTGELAGGDQWFGGRTNNPWKLDQGASGSSAGPGSATAGGGVGFSIGTETGGSILSPSARCGVTGLRPTFGRVSRYGAMTLSWTQDRLGPMCRSVEDCALVMQAISKPDPRDLSVQDVPFNWNAKLDVSKLRVGYLKTAFEETKDRYPDWLKADERTLAKLQELGVKLIPLTLPDNYGDAASVSIESAVFFDEFFRSGRDKLLTRKNRSNGFRAARFIPAVEYLQSQRVRAMMMHDLAKATEGIDVYIAPSAGSNVRAEGPAAEAAAAAGGGAAQGPQNLTAQHSRMANTACYPGLALPNGFAENGAPTSILFMARPFGETELLAVAKLYQDNTDFHRKHPVL
jgi:Asp-tRNA(Asn)/Glu-tRNA(Gln) amidotransferase A subunit family amidase